MSHSLERLRCKLLQCDASLDFSSGLSLLCRLIVVFVVDIVKQAENALIDEDPKFNGCQVTDVLGGVFLAKDTVADRVDYNDHKESHEDHQVYVTDRENGHQSDV